MAVGTRFCPSCGKPVVADARFCPSCGATLAFQQPPAPSYAPPPSYPSYQAPYQPTPKKSNTTLIIVIVIIAIVVVGAIAGILALGSLFNTLSTTNGHSYNLVNGLITVPASQYESYQFTVPSGAISIIVNGTFTASGGSGNNIEVLVFDSTNYVNWKNGNSASAYYDSGQVTIGTVSAALPSAGTYYLVYNNSFSTFSSKDVQTTVNLYYQG